MRAGCKHICIYPDFQVHIVENVGMPDPPENVRTPRMGAGRLGGVYTWGSEVISHGNGAE